MQQSTSFGTSLWREGRWQPWAALKARQVTQSQGCALQMTNSHFFYPAPYRDHRKHQEARKRGGFCLEKSSRSGQWPDLRSLPGICPACSKPFSRSTSAKVEALAMAVWETENSVNPHTPCASLLRTNTKPRSLPVKWHLTPMKVLLNSSSIKFYEWQIITSPSLGRTLSSG